MEETLSALKCVCARRLAHAGAVAWGQQGAKNWLQILNDHWIGPKNKYLCGNELTIADYFGAGLVSIGELIDCDFSAYPNIKRWLDNMKKLKSWYQVNEVFNGFAAANKGKEFVRVSASSLRVAPADAIITANIRHRLRSFEDRKLLGDNRVVLGAARRLSRPDCRDEVTTVLSLGAHVH